MKSLKLLLVCLLASTIVFAQKVTITGTVKGDLNGKDKIYITDLNAYKDTATIRDGKFKLEIPFKGAQFLVMNAQFEPGYRPVSIIFDQPGDINVFMDIKTKLVTFTGMESPVLYNEFANKIHQMILGMDQALVKKYGTAYPQKGDVNYNNCLLDRDRLYKDGMQSLLKDQASIYPDAYATAYILANEGPRYPLQLQEELYAKMTKKARETEKGKEFFAMIQGAKNSALGSKVTDFTLVDLAGKPVSFSQFKGKYVLIDFWASWCHPCRASFPRMRQVYEAFHKNGLEMFSISVDQKKADWLRAAEEEKLPWPQGLDTKQIAKGSFAVSAIPNLFLIGPDGKIILKELGADPKGGGEIERKLEEIYGKKVGPAIDKSMK
ncbi:TlpA disulfide reductase family protein [Pedobacter sp.]|jgi:thiol-disulfide isomerase/thioredoxin|uniref:TlpA disulfide reductase family protein n=1 Tax=Pedobacter sp. TaxID=1411316 RepID=UPI002BDE91F3|nr:TlpA disulfide reductase family protein [Pedobacter sp.]HWW40212.1 TlpA disulfide reductase family protein [Pedobacter sp.]